MNKEKLNAMVNNKVIIVLCINEEYDNDLRGYIEREGELFGVNGIYFKADDSISEIIYEDGDKFGEVYIKINHHTAQWN